MGLDRSFDRRRRRAELGTDSDRAQAEPAGDVRVKDGAGAPVPGATVEVAEVAFRSNATTGTDGSVTLRIPADAQVQWVVGFKSKVGFDYFENYDNRSQTVFNPLPAEVTLTLEAVQSVRIKAIGSSRQPVPGVVIKPARLARSGKKGIVQAGLCATLTATTDKDGVAYFDWLPTGPGDTVFNIVPTCGYSSIDPLIYEPLRASRPGCPGTACHVFERDGAIRRWAPRGADPSQGQRFGPRRTGAERPNGPHRRRWPVCPGRTSRVRVHRGGESTMHGPRKA